MRWKGFRSRLYMRFVLGYDFATQGVLAARGSGACSVS